MVYVLLYRYTYFFLLVRFFVLSSVLHYILYGSAPSSCCPSLSVVLPVLTVVSCCSEYFW
jgi:hypothetical protein